MLNQEIKRKINSARDILMDEIPNLQEQVNQITIALIYKFMDAIDRQNIKIGLQPQFFIKDLKNLSWTNLLNPTLSEQERFDLYAQNISQISKNPNIPQLFRDIFKEMFLPCNDTRILNLFLKEIDSFSCEHSENLGDAYEYLLNILGASGHTGHFLAPRHIIDFIVAVVAPQKSETILDPACGTADFLISAFKYIVKNNNLTQTDRTKLLKNVTGYDIAPDMVKLSLVNMYLHNFPEPKIYAYDILTSEDRWNDNFDVILSIPPFMTPKGGISPHKRFAIQATRSEVLFIDYIMEHLNIKGRAGIIVPEGIIFQSANVYKTLHKKLIEEGLFAIASLPSGVFNPYSGIKTSILFIDKQFAKKSNEILFLRLENDGFDLGMQRRQIDKNDLPQALKIIEEWKSSLTILTKAEIQVSAVTKEDIAKDDYNLTASHYVVGKNFENCKYELVRLDDICKFNLGESIMKKDIVKGNIPIISSGQAPTYYHNKSNRNGETIAISSSGANAGFISYWNTPIFLSDSFSITPKDDRLNTSFLYQVLKSQQNKIHALQKGVSIPHISWKDMANLQIPLPSLEVQKKIVEEIENKLSAINHADEIIKNLEKERKYFTNLLEEIEHKDMELGEICEELFAGGDVPKDNWSKEKTEQYTIPIYSNGIGERSLYGWTDIARVNKDAITISARGTIGYPEIRKAPFYPVIRLIVAVPKDNIKLGYLKLALENANISGNGNSIPQLTIPMIKQIKIPLPSLYEQEKIVSKIKEEESIIAANTKLIDIMQSKINQVINRIYKE